MIYIILAIICIIALIVGRVWGCRIGSQRANEKVREVNYEVDKKNQKLKEVQEDYINKNYLLSQQLITKQQEYNDKIDELREKYYQEDKELDQLHNIEVQNHEIAVSNMTAKLDRIKELRLQKANDALTHYRDKLYQQARAYEIELQKISHDKEQEIRSEITRLSEEIAQLKNSKSALIEAKKREEELKLKTDFYKIKITDDSKEDIKLLLSIEKFLSNKDPLYKLIWTTFYMTPLKELINRVIGVNKTSGIYKITNQLNDKVYIGQSVDVGKRWTDHIKASLKIGTIAHQKIHDAMAADGIENFTFELVEACPKEELNIKEKLWISTYQSDNYGYNQTAGGAKEA